MLWLMNAASNTLPKNIHFTELLWRLYMKLLFVAINAKYVHTNLAVRYLDKIAREVCQSSIMEFSINDNLYSMERNIMDYIPDVVAFSCYIWNYNIVIELCSILKKIKPDLKIVLGGPEVSYNGYDIIEDNSDVDYVIKGEAELILTDFIKHLMYGDPPPRNNLTFRENGIVVDFPVGELPDFSKIPFPYDDDSELNGKIVYYESSRGCPYSCKYCLSGENAKVRFKDSEIVKKDLKYFDDKGYSLVKFVDRTFNANRSRACEIWEYINDLKGDTRFHMEITGEILDEHTIELLNKVKPEKLQFEIGVQTTNTETMKAINRSCNINKLFGYISDLLLNTQIHIHLDLIVGLPHENMDSFKKSFNDVISLKPHVLQIGFLKLLKGSAMRSECSQYGIVYRDNAPYEIISNNYLTYDEISYLKDFEFVFDKIYNSGSFTKTIDYLFDKNHDKFELFAYITDYFRQNKLISKTFSKNSLFDILFDCIGYSKEFEEAMRYDYIIAFHPGKMPQWSRGDSDFRYSDAVYGFLKNEDIKKKEIPQYYDVPAKAIIKHVRFEKIGDNTYMFDYADGNVYDFTDYFIYQGG